MYQEVEDERSRLKTVIREWTSERVIATARKSRLSTEGSIEEIRDRIIRYDLRRLYGAEAARAYPLLPEDMASADLSESLTGSFDESIQIEGRLSMDNVPVRTRDSVATSTTTTTITTTCSTVTVGGTLFSTPMIGSAIERPSQYPINPILFTPIRPTAPPPSYPLHSTIWSQPAAAVPARTFAEGIRYPVSLETLAPSNPTVPLQSLPNPSFVSQPATAPQRPLSEMAHWQQANTGHFDNISRPPISQSFAQANHHPDASRSQWMNQNSTLANNSLDSTFLRENGACNLLVRYEVLFSGKPKEDVEDFLEKLADFQFRMRVGDEEILRLVPVIFAGPARYWARSLSYGWNSVSDMAEALRLQYGIPDFQNRLREEIRARTQGPDEPVASYLSAMRQLLGKRVPRLSEPAQLDTLYRNLHPDYTDVVKREQFTSYAQLQHLCQSEELKRERRRAYRPPPSVDRALFPELAYQPTRRSRTAAINSSEIIPSPLDPPMPPEGPVAAVQPQLPLSRSKVQPRASPPPIAPVREPSSPPVRNFERTKVAAPEKRMPIRKSIAVQTAEPPFRSRTITGDARSPTRNTPCWVCKQVGHWAYNCPSKNGLVCYRCNHPGVTTPRCPTCNPRNREGNGRRGN